MALTGNELVEITKPDAKGRGTSVSTLVPANMLTSLPAGTTVEVTPARTNGNQIANTRTVKISALGSVGANDTIDVHTPIASYAGQSARKQPQLASAVFAFVS